MKKLLSVALVAALLLCCTYTMEEETDYFTSHYEVVNMTLNYDTISILMNDSILLRISFSNLSEEASDSIEIIWSSSDSTIASVNNDGILKGHKIGRIRVTATYSDFHASCIVNVVEELQTIASEGVLNGLFSISPTQQAQFSQGNLQYYPKYKKWRFAEYQNVIVGSGNNKKNDESYNGPVDLFCWGTGNNPLAEDNSYGFADWGANKIDNGGNNKWRTLSKQEWFYILSDRQNASSLRSIATVNGVCGYILLPDEGLTCLDQSFTPLAENWATNNYSLSAWHQMEKKGAVFLPAAGYYWGLYHKDIVGEYWTSSTFENRNENFAAYFGFSMLKNNKEHIYMSSCRMQGLSVRLIRI